MSYRERLALDATLLAAVIAAANPAGTGVVLHEWIGFVLVMPAIIHLVSNWEWVVTTVANLFRKVRAAARVNLIVDLGFFGSFIAVTLSGFLVVPGLAASLGLNASPTWHIIHLTASNLTVGFALGHLALHAKWITAVVRRMVAPPTAPVRQRPAVGMPMGRPAPVPVRQYASAPERH